MSLSYSRDAILDSLYVLNGGLRLTDSSTQIDGTLRFNTATKTFEGYTGETGPLGETWRSLMLDIASSTTLGGIKVGSNLTITSGGVLSATAAGESRLFQNVITVSYILGAADYMTIQGAIDFINNLTISNDPNKPTIDNPFKIIVSPGIYVENIVLPDYVSLQGEGQGISIIRSLVGNTTVSSSAIVTLGEGSHLENIELQHYEGGALDSVAVYASSKQNLIIKDVKITMGETSTAAGVNVYGLYIINSGSPILNNVTIDIIKGTGNVYGMYFDPTSPIVFNSRVTINTASNNSYGLYHEDNSNGEYRSCYVMVQGSTNNIAMNNVNSTPYIYGSNMVAIGDDAYGIYNESTDFQQTINSSLISFVSNPTGKDVINLPSTTGFTAGSYIIVSGAASAKNNSTFLIESIPSSTQLVLGNNLLENEAVGQSVTIKQYYTMKIDFSFIQGSSASLKNENVAGNYAILGEKSTFSGTINDTITNNGLIFFQTYRSIVVSSQGGDFKNISDALDSIVDNSENRRYVIIVKSGIYTETAQIEMKEYVNIIGSGRDNTIINFDTHGATQIDGASVIMSSNIEISDITFQNETLTYYGADNRSVIYGNSVSNVSLKKVGINCNGGIDSSNEGLILRNSNGLNTAIILSDLKVSMNENAYNKGLSLYNSNLEIQGGEILINTNAVSNKGISSEECNFNMVGTKIQITNQDGTENYGLFTENTNLVTNYFIQFFSCNITVVGDNSYAVYTCDHQSIVGGSSNLVGENYYNLDVLMKSILKLHACWSAVMTAGNLVYFPISSDGIPMSSTNGNLFIGDEAGNLGVSGFSNTAIGVQSGSSLTSANSSTFLGFQSGNNVTSGSDNTFLGSQAGKETTTGTSNTFTGFEAGMNNITGTNNEGYGFEAMRDGTSGNNNVAIGSQAGYNINNDDNTFIGHQSGYSSTSAVQNTFLGGLSGYNNVDGSSNVLLGYNAGGLGVSANNVVAVGHSSGNSNTVSNNTFVGTHSGYENTTGRGQTMVGYDAGYNNTSGENNTLLGTETGYSLTTGTANLVAGARAGYSITTGSRNILMGSASTYGGLDAAGYSLNTGNDDVIIGSKAGKSLTNGSRNIIMGTEAGTTLLTGAENVLIGHMSGQSLVAQSGNVMIGNMAGQLNTNATGNNIMIGDNSGSNSDTSTSIFMGKDAGRNSTGTYNIGIGYESLKNISPSFGNTSTGNVFIGHHSGRNVRNGSRSVAIGGGLSTGSAGVLSSITDQNDNTAIGYLAGRIATSDGNTLIGSKVGYSLISGGLNSMLGYQAGYSMTSGQMNVLLGNDAGYNASTSSENTFIGYQSGYNTNTQSRSVAIGTQAGYQNTSTGVVSIGYRAGFANQLASYNLFIGYEAGGGGIDATKLLNASATSNVFIGFRAGYNAEGGASKNILIGSLSGTGLRFGQSNIMIGDESGNKIRDGARNIFIGPDSIGSKSEDVNDNVFIGSGSGKENVSGNNNLFIGTNAGQKSTESDNICFGLSSGLNMLTGEKNIYIGNSAAENNNTGDNNIVLGYLTGQGIIGSSNYSNSILIGSEAGRNNQSDNFLSIGTEAGKLNTTGDGNINIGYQSGYTNSVGNNNINIGAQAGFNTVSSDNIFIGAEAGKNNTVGTNNIILGGSAGINNAVGINNIFMGTEAGKFTTTSNNISIGTQAGVNNISGERNIYLGFRSGYNATNSNNIFLGNESGFSVTSAEGNLFMGSQAGFNTTIGGGNVFMGYQSGFNNTTGKNSMFIGFEAGYNNETGSDSLYLGYQSGYSNVSGSNNLAIGYRSQKLNTVGNQNIAIGNYSLFGNQFGDNNMVMGTNAASTGDIGDNNTIIGISSSRNIKNPGFQNNIAMGYNSSFQGFASSGSIMMGTNAVSEGIGGENNIVMGVNAGQSLGGTIPTITFGSGPYSNPNVNKEGYNVISVGSASVKKGQYLVIIYNNNSVYEPQVVYITQSGLTESTISANLTADINLVTDTVHLLYGQNSSVVESSLAGNSYFIVKTPKNDLDTLFNINDSITIQSLTSTNKQVINIVSTVVESGTNATGTTRINIDVNLSNTYANNDFIYLTRNKTNDIGPSDTSKASTNILIGNNAGNIMTFGSKNIAIGDDALINITTEKYNTAIGTSTGYHVKSQSNFLLGTKAGYYIDYATQGDGENTMIGFAAGQYAGITGTASNNVYIGNRVGQVNQGSNNIFIGNELETANSADISTATEFSNKFAIYKSDSGVPDIPLIGGDLNDNRVGILTMTPKSTFDVNGSFGKSINTVTQFSTTLDYQSDLSYQYPQYLDKTDTEIKLENTVDNVNNLLYFNNQGIGLIDSEFIIYNEKDITGLYLNNVTRGIYDTNSSHHLDTTPLFNIGAIKDTTKLSINTPSTGIISVTSTDIFDNGVTGLVAIDAELIQYNGKNGGLGQAERGYQSSTSLSHSSGTNVYNIATSISVLTETPLTNSMSAITTNVSMNPTGFPSAGYLIIDSEIIYYADNTPYLFDVTRGTNSTTSAGHLANDSVILVSDSISALNFSTLEDGITATTSQIQVFDMSDFNSSGYIIVEDEIIQYNNVALIDAVRGSNGTTPSLHGVDSVIRLISTSTNDLIYNFLDQAIDEVGIIGVTAMPPDTIILNDASAFPTNGTIFIDSEMITYTGKTANYLENVVRGVNGTIASPHSYGTNVYIIDPGLTTQGTINLLPSSSSIIEFLSNHNDFPKSGTVQIDNEIIKYFDMVLYNITRGISSTPINNHLTGLTCYNFSTLIDASTLSYTINLSSLDISIVNYGNFTPNGTILIGQELITYSGGIGIINVTRGILATIPTIHNTSTAIYSIPLLDLNYSVLSYNIQSEDTGIPLVDNTIYNSQGMVLIDSEIITYQNKKTLDNVIRGAVGSTASSHLLNTNVYNLTGVNTISSLTYAFPDGEDALPVDNISPFSSSGKIQVQTLVGGEIVKEVINYTNKGKSLVCSERGSYGSSIIGHSLIDIPNKYGVIYRITDLLSVPLKSMVEQLDETINADGSITSYPSTGIIRVGRELIEYNNKNYGLGIETRGYRGSTSTTHISGLSVYDLPILAQFTINPLLVSTSQIASTDLAVPVQSSLSAYNSTGYIILGAEIINYTNKNQSLVLDSNTRGLFGSTVQDHTSGTTVYSVVTSETVNIVDSEIQTDFIPLTTSHSFPSSGDAKVDSELIGYTSTNNTIVSTSRGSFDTTPAIHSIGASVRNISITGTTFSTESISAGQTTYIAVDNSSTFSNSGGYALIHANDQNKSEIIQYSGKGNTIVGVTRGSDQSIGISHASGSNFYLISNSVSGVELFNDIDNSETLIGVKMYDTMGITTLPSSGVIALNNELIEYTSLDSSLINANRAQNGTVAGTYLADQLVNQIRDYDQNIILHQSSITDIAVSYPFTIEYLIRGTNDTTAVAHNMDDYILILSDSHIDLNNYNVLVGDLNATDSFILLDSLSGLSGLVEGDTIIIDNEFMTCGNIISAINVIQITERGTNGTTPAYHYNNSKVFKISSAEIYKLAASITDTDTTLTFNNDDVTTNLQLSLPVIGTMVIGSEIIKYQIKYSQVGEFTSTQNIYGNYSLDSMVRGTNSTSAATHTKTTNVILSLTRNTTTLTTKTLNGEITNTATTITLNNVTGMATSGGYVLIDNEVIRYRGISGSNLTTCLRGYGYTTKNYHLTSSVVYIIDEPYQFFASSITTTGQTNVGVWAGNMPLSSLGSSGTILIDSEIIKYYSTGGTFTSKLIDCERNTGEVTYRYPPANIGSISYDSANGTETLSALPYGNGQYIVAAGGKSSGYGVGNAVNCYNVTTTLSTTIPDGISTSDIVVASTDGFPITNGKILIENEIISYTSVTSNTFVGITRGVNGTTGSSHLSGVTIYSYEPNEWRTNISRFNATTGVCIAGQNIQIGGVNYYGPFYTLKLPTTINPSYLYINENTLGKSNQIVVGATIENIGPGDYLSYNNWDLLYIGGTNTGENYIPFNTTNGYRIFIYMILSIVPNGSITYGSLKQFAIFSKYPENYGTAISTYQELQAINTNVTTLAGTYTLANDITIPDDTLWTEIGNPLTPFTGIFNGNNKTINGLSNFVLLSNDFRGLFGYNTGTIKNLNVNVTITIENSVIGGLIGYNAGTITNCSTSGYIYAANNSLYYFGGLCGRNDSSGIITYSNSSCFINTNGYELFSSGGFVGENKGQINNCYATGNVTVHASGGGFVGSNIDTTLLSSYINKCYATGNVSSNLSSAGGFVGINSFNRTDSLIENSYSIGNVTIIAFGNVGGFCGQINSSLPGSVTIINNCYTIGSVSGGSYIGGFIGVLNKSNSITNSFWNSTTAGVGSGIGVGTSTGLYSKTTTELKTVSTFMTVNWHLNFEWDLIESSYPVLLNEYTKYNKYTTAFQINTDKDVTLAKSQLSRNITATDESISVVNSSSFGSTGYLLVDSELIRYSSNSNNILGGLVRGLSLTTGATHSSGFPIYYLSDVPKLFYINNTSYQTQTIGYDLGPNNGITISDGLFTIITSTLQEFVKVDSIIGYNKNTHNADSQFLIDSEIMSSTKTIKTVPNIVDKRIKLSSQTTVGSSAFKILMDPNGLYLYIYYTTSGDLRKVLLSDNSVTSVSNIAGAGFNLNSGIIDSSGTYGYFGTNANPNPKIIKVALSTLTLVDSLTIVTTDSLAVNVAVIDKHNQYGYFSSLSSGPVIYKIQLSDLTLNSTSAPILSGLFSFAIIDQYDEYIYFATLTASSKIIKYTTASAAVTSLSTNANFLYRGVIDKNNQYAYLAGLMTPGRIIKLNLSTFTITDVLELPSKSVYNIGYSAINFILIDRYSKYAYCGTGLSTGAIIKINLETFTIDEINSITNTTLISGVIDIASEYLYVNSGTNTLNKVNISYTPTSSSDSYGIFYHLAGNSLDNTSDVIKLLNSLNISSSGTFKCGAIDSYGQYGYFGTGDSPGKVYKINMKTFAVVGSPITAAAGINNFVSAAISTNDIYLYLGTELASAARFVQVILSSFTFNATTYTSNAATLAISSCDVLSSGNILLGGTTAATPIRFYNIDSSLALVGSIVTYAYTGGGSAKATSTLIDSINPFVYFGINIVVVTPSASTITNVVRYTIALATPTALILTNSKSSNCGVIDNSGTYLYFGSSTNEEVYKVPASAFGSGTYDISLAGRKLVLGSGSATASLDVAVIDKFSKYAYFTSNSTTVSKVYQVDLSTFTQTYVINLGANMSMISGFIDPYEKLAYFATSQSSSTIFKMGITYLNNLDFLYDLDSAIPITSITYNGTTLGASTITPTSSDDVLQFNPSGGYVALLYYEYNAGDTVYANNPINTIIVKYKSISSVGVLQNLSVVSYQNAATMVTFTKMAYLRGSDNLVDPYASGLLSIGQNQISTSNSLVPISGTFAKIYTDTTLINSDRTGKIMHQYVQPTITHTAVNRHLRSTTIANHTTSSNLIRVTTTNQDNLRSSLNNVSQTIPITNGFIYGDSGYLLINSEIISYNNGYGINVTRGSYNTNAAYHYNTLTYYVYQLGASTTLRSSINSTIQNIPLTNITGLTSGSKYLITSASGNVDPEVVSGGSWNNTLDTLTRNIYSTGDNSYTNTGSNITIYSLQSITTPSTLRTAMTSGSKYVSLVGSGSSYPSQFNNTNYILIDTELMPITTRYSLDGINGNRNKYSTTTARAGYKSSVDSVTVTGHSTLRQYANSLKLFFPLNNADNYPISGSVVIDGEWISYNSKNSFDFAFANRGQYTTTPADYSADPLVPLLLIDTPTAHLTLDNSMTLTTKVISLNGANTNYTSNGIVLIESEIMQINSKNTFDNILRNRYLTETVSSTNLNFDIINTSVVTGAPENTIRNSVTITANSSCIPFEYVDDMVYGVTGVGLLDGEFFTWESKNSIDGLTRGVDGTSDLYHDINTGVNIVAEIGTYPIDINGNIIIYKTTIEGDKVLLSDSTSGIKILESQDINSFPPSGTIVIGTEKILYQSNKSLASITRGTNSTTQTSHTINDNIYLIDTTANNSITNTTLASLIVSSSDQITLTSVSGFSSAGAIIIESEIINYTGIFGNTLTGCTRGRYLTIATSHMSGAIVYQIPLQNVVRTTIIQNMNDDDLIVGITNTTGYGTQGTVLIGSEIMTYKSKNALSKITHGYDSTIPKGYTDNTPLEFTNLLLSDEESTVLIDTSNGDVEVNLPSAVDIKGRIYTVKKIASNNTLTIKPYDTELIDLQTSLSITPNLAFVAVQSDGVNWKLILNSQYDPIGSAAQAQSNAITAANLYTDNAIITAINDIATGITSSDFISEGTTNLYFTEARVITTIQNNITTDDITEGITNLYFTDARAVLAMTGLYDPIGSASQAQTNAITIAGTNAINTIVAGAPSTMDTLNKISSALNNDSSFYDTIINLLAEKLNITTAFSLLPPVGTIVSYAGDTAPSKWTLCYGQELSTTTYSALYAAIGTTYGTPSGPGLFKVPDCRGRTMVGPDAMGGTNASRVTANNTLGAASGAETHILTVAQMPRHTHKLAQYFSANDSSLGFVTNANYSDGGGDTTYGISDYGPTNNGGFWMSRTAFTGGSGSSIDQSTNVPNNPADSHNIMQPYIVVNYIIFTNV